MRILVSGATGVVGKRAVPLLLEQQHSVTALVRNPAASGSLERAGAKIIGGGLFDREALKRAVPGHEVIVNLATHIPSSSWRIMFRSAWRENDRIRTEGVANLIEAALDCGVRTFIQESFAPTYPDRGSEWIDERTPLEPVAYNKTVLDAERSVANFAEHGGRGVVLRFAGFYGPDAFQVKTYIDALRKGWAALPGAPHRYISSISHDDAATAVVAGLKAPSGPYNVSDDEPVTRSVFFGTLAQQLGLKPPRFLPEWITPLLGSIGEAASRSLRLSNGKLRRATDWTPQFRSVQEGWPATLAQMKQT